MALPNIFDPKAVEYAAALARQALAGPQYDHLTATERRAVVEHAVNQLIGAGAHIAGDRLVWPAGPTPTL